MKKAVTYVDSVLEYLKCYGFVTYKDISRITNCNCSYSVLRDLRRKCTIIERWVKRGTQFTNQFGKTYTVFKPFKVFALDDNAA